MRRAAKRWAFVAATKRWNAPVPKQTDLSGAGGGGAGAGAGGSAGIYRPIQQEPYRFWRRCRGTSEMTGEDADWAFGFVRASGDSRLAVLRCDSARSGKPNRSGGRRRKCQGATGSTSCACARSTPPRRCGNGLGPCLWRSSLRLRRRRNSDVWDQPRVGVMPLERRLPLFRPLPRPPGARTAEGIVRSPCMRRRP